MTISMPRSVPLPKAGLLEALGQGLGQGAAMGGQQAMNLFTQLALERQKQALKQQGIQKLLGTLGFGAQEPMEVPQQADMSSLPQQPKAQPQQTQLERIATNPQLMANLAAVQPQIAAQVQEMYKSNLKQKELAQKHKYEQSKLSLTANKPYIEKMGRQLETLDSQRLSLDTMKNAIETGNLGKWSTDYLTDVLADATGIESFRNLKSLKGAQLVAAQKTLFSDLRELFPGQIRTAELNIFSQFLPQLGRSKEANLAVLGMLESIQQMKEAKARVYERIIEQNNGIPPMNIQQLVGNETKGQAKQIMDNYRARFLTKEQPAKSSKTQSFTIQGQTYNIPNHLVPAFKKDMGIK